ncbi:MAG: hypothetical protein ABSH34_28260 [Verrucomicrobiota bacterium]|jgi:hypothetical protein
MSITSLTPPQLRQAADIQEQIEALEQQLNAILGGDIWQPFRRRCSVNHHG